MYQLFWYLSEVLPAEISRHQKYGGTFVTLLIYLPVIY